MGKYTHVLFDLDGTVVDSSEGIVEGVKHGLEALGITETDDEFIRARFIGPPLIDSFTEYYHLTEAQGWEAIRAYRVYYRSEGVLRYRVYEGIPALVRTLHEKGLKVWLATSKPYEFAHRILEHASLLPYFDFVSGASFDASRNTKDKVIEYALKENGITDTSRFLMVGDRFHDVLGAREFGIDTVGVLFGFGTKEEFIKYDAAYIAENTDELLTICLS